MHNINYGQCSKAFGRHCLIFIYKTERYEPTTLSEYRIIRGKDFIADDETTVF